MAKPHEFCWTYTELAKLTDMTVNAVHQARSRNEFDPNDFKTLFPWLARKGTLPIREAILHYGFFYEAFPENPLMARPRRRQRSLAGDQKGPH